MPINPKVNETARAGWHPDERIDVNMPATMLDAVCAGIKPSPTRRCEVGCRTRDQLDAQRMTLVPLRPGQSLLQSAIAMDRDLAVIATGAADEFLPALTHDG